MDDKRRKEDSKWIDHEQRVIDLEAKMESLWWHHRNDNLIGRLNSLENSRNLKEIRLDAIEKILANGGLHDATFTDKQVKWLKDFFEERKQVDAGRALFRLLWAAGLGAASALLTYFGIKGR